MFPGGRSEPHSRPARAPPAARPPAQVTPATADHGKWGSPSGLAPAGVARTPRMHKCGLTATLRRVPVASAVLLVVALGFAARAQSGYAAAIAQGRSRIAAARYYASVLEGALKLHSRYLDLATARLAGAIGPREVHSLNALPGATLDRNAGVDELRRDRHTTPASAAELERVSRALAEFQGVLARLTLERPAAAIRADVVLPDQQFEELSASLTRTIGAARLCIVESLEARAGLVRTLLTIVAGVLLLVSVLAIALTLWARRAVARLLGARAGAPARPPTAVPRPAGGGC